MCRFSAGRATLNDNSRLHADDLVRTAPLRRCSRCGVDFVEMQAFLDSRNGKTTRMFRCDCPNPSWFDDRAEQP